MGWSLIDFLSFRPKGEIFSELILFKCGFATVCFKRVLVPDDEILSFAWPKKSIQKKRPPDTTPCGFPTLLGLHWVCRKGLPTPSVKDVHPCTPLRAIPIQTCDARRGRREVVPHAPIAEYRLSVEFKIQKSSTASRSQGFLCLIAVVGLRLG